MFFSWIPLWKTETVGFISSLSWDFYVLQSGVHYNENSLFVCTTLCIHKLKQKVLLKRLAQKLSIVRSLCTPFWCTLQSKFDCVCVPHSVCTNSDKRLLFVEAFGAKTCTKASNGNHMLVYSNWNLNILQNVWGLPDIQQIIFATKL